MIKQHRDDKTDSIQKPSTENFPFWVIPPHLVRPLIMIPTPWNFCPPNSSSRIEQARSDFDRSQNDKGQLGNIEKTTSPLHSACKTKFKLVWCAVIEWSDVDLWENECWSYGSVVVDKKSSWSQSMGISQSEGVTKDLIEQLGVFEDYCGWIVLIWWMIEQ